MSATGISDRIARLRKFTRAIGWASVQSRVDAACEISGVNNDDLRWLDQLLDAVAREDNGAIERLRAHWNVP